MKISVVIATYNRRHLLAGTLPTVLAQEFPPNEFEVVVVVDGSSDGTAEWLRTLRPPCSLGILEQANQGQGIARNAGVRAARGELILFLDDDILCSPTLLREHVAAHAGAAPQVVYGHMLVAPESPTSLTTEWVRDYIEGYHRRVATEEEPRWGEDFSIDPNASLPRETFLAAGGFDPRFSRAKEDLELGLRLRQSGVPFRLQPTAITRQIVARSAQDIAGKRAGWQGGSLVHICRLYPAYRAHLPLAWLMEGPFFKRLARTLAVRSALPADALLRVSYWVAERLRAVPAFRRAGISLLQRRYWIALFRGALREMGSWKALRAEFGMQLPVLLYHHVGPTRLGTNLSLTLSARQFEQQVSWLARHGFTGIRPSDWLAWCQQGTPLPEKPVLLTFDDAYADIAIHALPVLHHRGWGAAVFLPTALVGQINTWDAARWPQPHNLMTADQIREWAARGIEFGAHSRTHRDLTTVSEDNLQEEVAGSADDLAALLGGRPSSFAYPYGPYNNTVVRSVQESFQLAFTCEEGLNNLRTNPYRLRRTPVLPSDSLLGFSCRVRWGHNPIHRLRTVLRPRTRMREAWRRLHGQPA